MKPAPAAVRAMDVLSFMAANAPSSFTLSELAAATHVSQASMSSILLALTDSGYLIRHPRHRTFELGPSLVALGHTASMRYPVVDLARAEMPALAALGSECIGSAVVGTEIVNLVVEGRASAATQALRVGQRIPLVPPYGHVFLAWSSRDSVGAWLARLGSVDPAMRGSFDRSLECVRTRGFAIALENERVKEVQRLVEQVTQQRWNGSLREQLSARIPEQAEEYALTDVEPDRVYTVNNLAAPIFGVNATVVFALTIHGIGSRTGQAILEIGRQLSETCHTLTRRLGGRMPSYER